MNKRRFSQILTLLVCIIVLLTVSGCGSKEPHADPPAKPPAEEVTEAEEPALVTVEEPAETEPVNQTEPEPPEPSVQQVRHEVLPSAVTVKSSADNFGTGFAIDDGYIVTNQHVLYGSEQITVTDGDGNSYFAEIIGTDIENDVALLRIDAQLPPIAVGDPNAVTPGDSLTVLGNPDNGFPLVESRGVALALEDELLDEIDRDRQYIWFDAEVVSGYSGGPVYNDSGEVVGILFGACLGDLSAYPFDHLSGVIPIDRAMSIVDELLNK